MSCLNSASQQQKGRFAAIKMTGLGQPDLLQHITLVQNSVKDLFLQLDVGEKADTPLVDRRISLDEFVSGMSKLCSGALSEEKLRDLFYLMHDRNSGTNTISLLEWMTYLHPRVVGARELFVSGLGPKNNLPHLSEDEVRKMDAMFNRLDVLCAAAEEKGVRLMIDAGQCVCLYVPLERTNTHIHACLHCRALVFSRCH